MSLRPVISAPLPWLTMAAGKILARKRPGAAKRFFNFPRTLRFTKEGARFLAVLFLIGLAAINTGNNLLYLVLAMLLSLIVISGLLSESTLRKISAARELPPRIFRDTPVEVRLRVRSGKRFLSSYSFTVGELDPEGVETDGLYVLKLDRETTGKARYTFKRRGVVRLTGLVFKTRFPFGLFIKGRTQLAMDETIVLPRIRPLEHGEMIESMPAPGAAPRARAQGTGVELYGLRDYTLTDDSRLIHWKASAKSRKLIVKEFERETEKRVVVFFNNLKDAPDKFELMVERAASLANHFMERGFAVGLRTLSADIPCAAGKEQLHRILHALALVEPLAGAGEGNASVLVTAA